MNDNRKTKLPISVADAFAEDILDLSDDEVMREAQEKYRDVELEISNTRNVINSAVMKSRKSKLAAAREHLDSNRNQNHPTNILSLSIGDKRKLITQAKQSVDSLTLAARNEEEMTESDADGLLQDLIDLGVIDEDGNIK